MAIFRRTATSVGGTTAALLLMSGLTFTPPAFAAGCYGDYCSGKNPYDTGCADDAYTWGTDSIEWEDSSLGSTEHGKSKVIGTVSLVISKSCGTRWGVMEITDSVSSTLKLKVEQETTEYKQEATAKGAGGRYYTLMTYSRDHCSSAAVYIKRNQLASTGCALF